MSPDGTLTVQKVESTREQWLERRRAGIGGSDAPVILGLSPWKSPLALWSEKVGLVQPDDIGDREYVEWGNILEAPIATKYAKITGRTLIDHGRFHIFQHPDRAWQICTIDREILPIDDRGPGDLSIKTAGAFRAHDWEEEPPLMYQAQLNHELMVRDMLWGSFAVLIGGQKFRWCDQDRNEKLCSLILEREEEFWDRVQREDPPAADASDSTKEVLLRLYPRDTGESIALPGDASEWAERWAALKTAIKQAETDLQEVENKIKAAIGNATLGLLPDGSGFKWALQQRKAYTVAASEFRVLREVKAK